MVQVDVDDEQADGVAAGAVFVGVQQRGRWRLVQGQLVARGKGRGGHRVLFDGREEAVLFAIGAALGPEHGQLQVAFFRRRAARHLPLLIARFAPLAGKSRRLQLLDLALQLQQRLAVIVRAHQGIGAAGEEQGQQGDSRGTVEWISHGR